MFAVEIEKHVRIPKDYHSTKCFQILIVRACCDEKCADEWVGSWLILKTVLRFYDCRHSVGVFGLNVNGYFKG
jgi:hypothetical protein